MEPPEPGRGKEDFSPRDLGGSPACQQFDFSLLVSRTCVVLSHQVVGICYGIPRKPIHPPSLLRSPLHHMQWLRVIQLTGYERNEETGTHRTGGNMQDWGWGWEWEEKREREKDEVRMDWHLLRHLPFSSSWSFSSLLLLLSLSQSRPPRHLATLSKLTMGLFRFSVPSHVSNSNPQAPVRGLESLAMPTQKAPAPPFHIHPTERSGTQALRQRGSPHPGRAL